MKRKPTRSRKSVRRRNASYSRSIADTHKIPSKLELEFRVRSDRKESRALIFKTYDPADPNRQTALDNADFIFRQAMLAIANFNFVNCLDHVITVSRNHWFAYNCPH